MTVQAITGVGRLWTGADPVVVEGATVVIDGDRVVWTGERDDVPGELLERADGATDVGGGLVTPGLIDAHTHPVHPGPRAAEIVARSRGLAYADLDEESGIAATVAATRAVDRDELEVGVRARMRGWLRSGTTTVEAKTGYHLTRDGELDAVRMLAGMRGDPRLPDVHVTFLAAHALPPERSADRDGYVEEVAGWSDAAAAAGADACDVFCDAGYFTVEESRRVLTAGREAGLVPRIHADELERTGGALLAAELGCASADHLLRTTAEDAHALAGAGVVATLCPTTALAMGARPDVEALREAGTVLALGSDHNPGASGLTAMSPVIALSVWGLGLSVDEALRAATSGGARALRLGDRGVLRAGARADIVAWDAAHEGELVWSWGTRARRVWRAGEEVER